MEFLVALVTPTNPPVLPIPTLTVAIPIRSSEILATKSFESLDKEKLEIPFIDACIVEPPLDE